MSPRLKRAVTLGAVLALLALPTLSHGASGEQLTSSWASVNICSPTQLGARAQLAGDGSTQQLYVRFTAQWLSPTAGWVALDGPATSPWQYAGTAEYTWSQAGWTYSLNVPPVGQAYQLRATAELQWRDGGSVVRSETRVTGTCTVGG